VKELINRKITKIKISSALNRLQLNKVSYDNQSGHFGSSGMIGMGLLFECLNSAEASSILVINRHPLGISHPKLEEVVLRNFSDLPPKASYLRNTIHVISVSGYLPLDLQRLNIAGRLLI
jgi:hypothetical protein